MLSARQAWLSRANAAPMSKLSELLEQSGIRVAPACLLPVAA
jgi:hypothetical protein